MVELIVSMGVLVLMIVLIAQLFNSAMTVTTQGSNHMDADAQARAVFDRMAIDFSQIVKRRDVDYFLKDSNNPQTVASTPPGNDQVAFYTQSPGYFPSTTSAALQSPISLVAYRINADTATNPNPNLNKLQRLGYGLLWNGASTSNSAAFMPVVFTSGSGPNTIVSTWPAATSNTVADNNYELIGPQVFRMEYYYVLKGQTVSGTYYPSRLSDTPWDSSIPSHTSVNGLQDVAAIGVLIAVIDPKNKSLLNNTALTSLAGRLEDFSTASTPSPGDLQYAWQKVLNDPSNGIPRLTAASIRIYERYFYLSSGLTPVP